jgi:hypothetical protein
MRPDMLHNWCSDEIAEHLEQFYHDLFRSPSWTGRASSALALATIEATIIRFAILACRVPLSKIELNNLIEMCRVVDTVLIDQETIYAPRHGNDRLLLGLKGSLNEYELDLLSARYEKARRGELVVSAPVGFVKAGDRYEKDPDVVRRPSAWSSTKSWSSAAPGRLCFGSTSMISICRRRARMARRLGGARTTPPSTE